MHKTQVKKEEKDFYKKSQEGVVTNKLNSKNDKFLNSCHSKVNMIKTKYKISLILVFAFILLGFASAEVCGVQSLNPIGSCTPQVYDSCYICMNMGLNPSTNLSDYVVQFTGDSGYYEPSLNTVCGAGFYDILEFY